MRELTRLQSYQELSEQEACEVLIAWITRHSDMLDNLLRIKSNAPGASEQGGFRRQRVNTVSLETLRGILTKFNENLLKVSQGKLEEGVTLVDIIEQTCQELKSIYQGQSTAFAVILNELIELQNVMLQKMPGADKAVSSANGKTALKPEEVRTLVYVRIFHRQLPQLTIPETDKSWLKTIFESVRESEKHGLAVYAEEAQARRSLRGENYGYVTVAIQPEQDITHLRRVKQDPHLECALLTIAPLGAEQLKKLTYAETDYTIHNGIITKVG